MGLRCSLPEESLCFSANPLDPWSVCPNPNRGRYVIEAEVKPPATTPAIFCINIKLRSAAGINNCGAGELLDESQSCIFTHFEPNNLFDYWDGHSLPALDLPFAKKQLVVSLELLKVNKFFGANQCFKRDQLRLIQHTSASEALYKDLLLLVQLEESLMLYQMGQLEECKQVGEDVCIQANNTNSPNYNAIAGSAKSLLSSAYKMEKDFPKAEELINSSTELLEAVVQGEVTSINRTCLAAFYSEKAAVMGITKLEKKKLKKAMKDVMLHFRHQLDKQCKQEWPEVQDEPLSEPSSSIFNASREKATDMLITVSEDNLGNGGNLCSTVSGEVFSLVVPRETKHCFTVHTVTCSQGRDSWKKFVHLSDVYSFSEIKLLDCFIVTHTAISLVSEASRIAEDLQLQADIKGTRERLQQLNLLRLERGETARRPHDMAEDRMVRSQPFQEPRPEILERYLGELTRLSRF
ncbi:hypothetical protein OS493_003333 [Desmophyllum pertusum]|uniref:Uncharacterized protein n=1 Tax=Desmophyllum pertusum TaxID=174260 RepID=A0A9X0A599_9CNID|nr:hypothetical protein OS493_003333 [Desmophyllum pertusum]